MDKGLVRDYFDAQAHHWDEELVRNDEIIGRILDNTGVSEGTKVLDVACGTGVLMPDYLSRGVESVLGIDISPEMIKRAEEKFQEKEISFICGDVELLDTDRRFDCIVIYNAFPHFPEPERLIERLSGMLVRGGRLTVAHGMSRKTIDSHHSGSAKDVSMGLMDENRLADIFGRFLEVTVKLSDERMYQVVGVKG